MDSSSRLRDEFLCSVTGGQRSSGGVSDQGSANLRQARLPLYTTVHQCCTSIGLVEAGTPRRQTMPIDEPSSPGTIQTSWREALRQLAESAPGSPDADRLAARVHDLAREYRIAVERTRDADKARGRRPPLPKST